MTTIRCCVVATAVFLVSAGPATAERVVRVIDGDSIVVDSSGNRVEVRIADIDAPEMDQPHGEAAKAALEALVGDRVVRLELIGGDVYRRIVANVFVDERDVAAELVAGGWAWVRRAYAPAARLIELEEEAHGARRGLWAEDSPNPPWIWRRTGGNPSLQSVTPECGSKTSCREMSSCEEAIAYLSECKLDSIDGDGDGIPCESLCRYYR